MRDASNLHGGVSQQDARKGITAWNLFVSFVACVGCAILIAADAKLSADTLAPYLGIEMAWVMSVTFGNALQTVLTVYVTDGKWVSQQSMPVLVVALVVLVLCYIFDIASNYEGFIALAQAYREAKNLPGPPSIVLNLIVVAASIILSVTEWLLMLSWGKLSSDWVMYRAARKGGGGGQKPQQPQQQKPQQPPPQQKPQQQQQKPQQKPSGPPPLPKSPPKQEEEKEPDVLDDDLKAEIIKVHQQTGQPLKQIVLQAADQLVKEFPNTAKELRAWAEGLPAPE